VADRHEVIDLTDTALLTDDELVTRAREGDRRAFGTLYLRHRDAAWRVACAAAAAPADAEDAVAEGFAKVFAALPRMMNRDIAFRAYLLACVRNAAIDRHRRDRHVDRSVTVPDAPGQRIADQPDDAALLDLERNLVGEALQSLPERWRTVLWLTEVEGMTPAEVSGVLGIKPNAVAALSYRAREGLREAYLQAHLRAEAPAECRATVDRLGPYVRGELGERDRLRVQAHLDDCVDCRRRRDELADVNATLRAALVPVPLVLGAAAQKKWLTVAHLGKGTRTIKPPARAAKSGQIVNSPAVKSVVAGLSAFVIMLGAGMAIRGFDHNRNRTGSPGVAAPANPPGTDVLGEQVAKTPEPPAPTATGVASAPRNPRFHTPEPPQAGTPIPSGNPTTPTGPPSTPPPTKPAPNPPVLAAGVNAAGAAQANVAVGGDAGLAAGVSVAGNPVIGTTPPQPQLACVAVVGNQVCTPI